MLFLISLNKITFFSTNFRKMKFIQIYILLSIFLIFSPTSLAQTAPKEIPGLDESLKGATFRGVVMDDQYKLPVKFANIGLFNLKDSSVVSGTVCDENGYFEIINLPFGDYYAIIDFIGYERYFVNDIQLSPKMKLQDLGTVYLRHLAVNVEEVEIVGERNYVEYKIDKKVINISKNINASGGSLVDALENAPSIQVDIEGNVTMRGSTNFKVLIDGKPTVLDANDILQQIPPSSVENIEIITNPSVKYDPDGTSGILNIIMKKNYQTGLTGVVNTSVGTGDKYSADFLINYRVKKSNYYIGANYGDRKSILDGTSLRKTFADDDTFFLDSEYDRFFRRNYYSVKGGIDYYMNDRNTISIGGRFGYFGFQMGTDTRIHEYYLLNETNNFSYNEGLYDVSGNFYSANIDFTHNFVKKGHELSFSVQYSGRSGGNETNTKETASDDNFVLTDDINQFRSFQDRSSIGLRIKADYVLPVNEKIKLEAGYQSRIRSAGGDYTFEDLINNQWLINDLYTNELIFERDIHSIYTSIRGQILGVGYMAGLRGEYTNRLIEQITSGESYPVERFDFFPSVHLSKDLPNKRQLQLSYSKRIERPRHWYLNPFPGYADEFTVRIGNPGLLPEFIDSYELSYQKRIKQSFFNIDAYFRQKNNNISRTQQLLDDGRLLMTFENIDKEFSYGSEISGNIMLNKWWTIYANANIYRYNVEGDVAGVTTDLKSLNYDFRLNTSFIFSKTSRLQVSGFYNGPTVTAQGEREDFWFAGLAYRHEFFKRKLSLVLNVRDVFRTGGYKFTAIGEGFSTENEMLRESPVFSLSLSYKINNYSQKRDERNGMNEMDEGGMM